MCNQSDQAGLGLPALMSGFVVLVLHRVMDDTVDQPRLYLIIMPQTRVYLTFCLFSAHHDGWR
jgi:hypothetical protein